VWPTTQKKSDPTLTQVAADFLQVSGHRKLWLLLGRRMPRDHTQDCVHCPQSASRHLIATTSSDSLQARFGITTRVKTLTAVTARACEVTQHMSWNKVKSVYAQCAMT